MRRVPHLSVTVLVIGLIYLSTINCLQIDESTLTLASYTVIGDGVAGSSSIQMTPDADGKKARALYLNAHDVALGFTIEISYSVAGVGTVGFGEAFGFVLSGDKNNFLNAVQAEGGSWDIANLSNMVAIGVDSAFGRVYFCQINNTATLPSIYLAMGTECSSKSFTYPSNPPIGLHTMRIDYAPNGPDTTWTIKVDGLQNTFFPGPMPITPVTPNENYFGWTASTGASYSDRTLLGWTATIIEPCVDNGGCSPNATCEYIGNGQVNCTCIDGYQGDGYTCSVIPPVSSPVTTPVAAPISPPVTSPVSEPAAAPIDPPVVVDPPIDSIITTPTAIGPEVLVPSIVIPVVAVGAALFFGIYFGKKAQEKKKEKDETEKTSDVEEGEGAIELRASRASSTAVAPSNYSTVPAINRASGQYNSIPEPESGVETSDVGVSEINPVGINPADIDKRMHIPYKSLVFTKEIGAGSYGKWRGAEVAIKVNNTVTDMDGFLAEAKLTLGIAPHPNLVQTFGVSLDGSYPCIVLEFCGGGSLDKLVFGQASASISDTKRKEIALKIAYGLIHLHNNNIVHRDLAARNILLSTEGQPKVSDFGMSRILQDEDSKGKTKTNIGPLRWMSPESLNDKSYSVKSDVWSYGILVWEIVAGTEPHSNEDQLFVGVKIRDEAFHPTIPDNCDPVLREVMEMCWKKDPAERPTMEEIAKYLRKHN